MIILCACGCGKKLDELNKWGHPRRYIFGHHTNLRAKKYCNHDKETLNTTKNRFYSKVLLPNENGCMEWIGGMNKRKRAHFVIQYKPRKSENAARYSYRLFYGADAGELYVCHTCDNPMCVAPDHLWLGTQKQNMQDMFNKGRRPRAKPRSKNKRNKLTQNDVLKIREILKKNNQIKILANQYNVSQDTITDIKNRRSWKNI